MTWPLPFARGSRTGQEPGSGDGSESKKSRLRKGAAFSFQKDVQRELEALQLSRKVTVQAPAALKETAATFQKSLTVHCPPKVPVKARET